MYLLSLSFFFPSVRQCFFALSHSGLLLVNWGTYVSVSVWKWLQGIGSETRFTLWQEKKGEWNPGTSAQRGTRLKEVWRSTGQCWPAVGRKGFGERAQWSAANLSFPASHRVFTQVLSGVLLDCGYI